MILAVAPGKRELGLAVFTGNELAYFSVKTIRNRKSKRPSLKEINFMMQKLFTGFPVRMVVIKAISQYQRLSPDLESVVARIKFESAQKNLPVAEITLDQIKSVLGQGEKSTEKKAFETLLEIYPELQRYWNRPNKWQSDYYAFLFSAVAVGVVYLKTASRRN
jgi:Holliday junction resolvasome RuvABC endonuclease subunit